MLFEKASKYKLRFNYKGIVSTEDLWDLTLTGLNYIFKDLNAKLKETEDNGLLCETTKANTKLKLKLEIVKHIFLVKKTQMESNELKVKNAHEKQKLLELISDKENEALKNMTKEELLKMVDKL